MGTKLKEVDICNFADDTTPFICDYDLKSILEKLEQNSELAILWFENNYMKLNTDKCHLLVSGYRFEELWVKIGNDTIWETKNVKLLGVTIDNELKFNKHLNDICKKANRKLGALSRLSKFLSLKKRRMLYKAFIESQFKYCPLVWMFHSRSINNKINKIQERALRLVYDDYTSSFKELLIKDKSFTIHNQNIQCLAIEIYKVMHNLSTNNFKEMFILQKNNLRSQSDLLVPSVNTVHKGQNSLRYFGPIIWNSIPQDIRNSETLSLFKSKIKNWKPVNCKCRLCLDYVSGVGYL